MSTSVFLEAPGSNAGSAPGSNAASAAAETAANTAAADRAAAAANTAAGKGVSAPPAARGKSPAAATDTAANTDGAKTAAADTAAAVKTAAVKTAAGSLTQPADTPPWEPAEAPPASSVFYDEAGKPHLLAELLSEAYCLPADAPEALKEAFLRDKARAAAIQSQAMRLQHEGTMRQYLSLLRAADGLRRKYPGFDLPALCQDKRFTALLAAGEEMEQAYCALYSGAVLKEAIRRTADYTAAHLQKDLAAAAARPREGAMAPGSTAYRRADPADMTRAQREAIAKRVLRGEKVIL